MAVADVDDTHASETADRIAKEGQGGKRPETMRDYRKMLENKDIDAVVIATPDHWHAHPTIHACQAGKDVYCEKPLAHNVREGRAMVNAARKYDRVVAVGTQQRSSENFQKAVEAVQSGVIGQVHWVQTWNFENISPLGMGIAENTNAPETVDYDRWLGPAPEHPFNVNRFHLLFRWFFDYAGGMMSDWGVHLNDIVLWALDQKGPATVIDDRRHLVRQGRPRHARHHAGRLRVPRRLRADLLDAQGERLPARRPRLRHPVPRHRRHPVHRPQRPQDHPDTIAEPYGIKLIKGDVPHRSIDLKPESFKAADDGLPSHVDNFLSCLKSRERPTCDVETTHFSTNTTHLGNVSYLLGRKLTWDAEKESFVGDDEANRLLGREYRQGYELPEV